MSSTVRRTVRAYLDRRTPWGPPWWVYAVALGAANLVRQAVLWRTDAGPEVGLAAFVAMVLVVFGAVTGVAALLRGSDRRHGAAGQRPGPRQLTLWAEGANGVEDNGGEAVDEGGDQSYVASADHRLPSTASR